MPHKGPRFIPNTGNLSKCTNHRENLEEYLTAIVTGYPPTQPPDKLSGLFYGYSSVAYLFLALSRLYSGPRALHIQGKSCKQWSEMYAYAGSNQPTDADRGRWGVGDNGLVTMMISAAATQKREHVEKLCGWAQVIAAPDEKNTGSNEWLYGRAGYLYMLRAVKSWCTDPELQKLLTDTAERVIDRIVAAPRPWVWHGGAYIGAAHGSIGIITQVVLSSPSRAKDVKADLEEILKLQRPDGNWGPAMPDDGDDRLVQFCHGAPGTVISLLSIKNYFPELEKEIDEAIAKGRECTWRRGLLTKAPSLCHGISGNALALDWERFEKFMSLTTIENVAEGLKEGTFILGDAPWSLMCGAAGRAWCWAVADLGPEMEGRFIGYNDV